MKSPHLSLEKMFGQGSDRASSMPGKEKGIQAIVKETCPLRVGLYVHCSAQVLNLILIKFCAIPEIHSTIDFIRNIVSFLNQAVKEIHN